MNEYVKINTIWKRDERGRVIEGDYATPELAFLADCRWEWTEKVDGTNIGVSWDGAGGVEFGGRTDNAQLHAGLVSALRDMFGDKRLFEEKFGDTPTVLYGEGYGAGIQKGGGNYSPDKTFVLFDVKCGAWWLRREAVLDVAAHFNLRTVPVLMVGTLAEALERTKAGITSTWGEFQAEGMVGRPLGTELFARNGERIIVKMKTRDFPAPSTPPRAVREETP